jgi:hypothetical protein
MGAEMVATTSKMTNHIQLVREREEKRVFQKEERCITQNMHKLPLLGMD